MAPRRGAGADDGAVLVEFALVASLLIMLLFGIVEFGRGYSASVQLNAAVREGARAAALGQNPTPPTLSAASGLTGVSVVGGPCAANDTTSNATVTATYPFTYDIPFFGSKTITMTAKGVMRCGG